MFLKDFVGNVPWAHFDIAGTAFLSEAKRYLPKYATGVGVRLMLDYFASMNEQQYKSDKKKQVGKEKKY
jgi:leucyl aminopeptidase